MDDKGLVKFETAPWPLPASNLVIPGTDQLFFAQDGGGRFHVAPRGGKLYEHPTYDDARSLVVVPHSFDPDRPAALVLFFHGNGATLTRDVVRRQRVAAQFERSGLNAVLVAPQLAVDALDSSPGRFWEPDFLDAYLAEAACHLSERSGGRVSPQTFDRLPLILVAYSGGYLATAFCLPPQTHSARRIAGVVLLDALFGEEPKFARWIEAAHAQSFFVSAYSAASAGLDATLAETLAADGLEVRHDLPAELRPGAIVLKSALAAIHNDFVTAAWTRDPLADVLRRIDLGAS